MKTNRETWLLAATDALKPLLAEVGHPLIEPVQVSCGFPSSGRRSSHVGECWPRKKCVHGTNQIFISPTQHDAVEVLDTLLHELIHAVDDCEHKHGKAFKKIALKLGMVGPMRSAGAGEKLKGKLQVLVQSLGPYPHGALQIALAPRVSKPRPRARCPQCEYQVPMLKKFLEWGPPLCPEHRVPMVPLGDWGDVDLTMDLSFDGKA